MLRARVQTGVVELNVVDYQHVMPAHAVVATYSDIRRLIVDRNELRFRISLFDTGNLIIRHMTYL